jgi:hypothetical protein
MARTPARPANGMVLQFAHEMRGRQAPGRQTNSTNRPCYLVNSLEPGKNKGVKKGSPIEAVAHADVVTRPFRADTGADNAVPEAASFPPVGLVLGGATLTGVARKRAA